ncbi:MAG: DUF2335 domain-containing protein [Pseudonocardiaceae bacterium]
MEADQPEPHGGEQAKGEYAELVEDEAERRTVKDSAEDDLIGVEHYSRFSGPLPHPNLFARYDEVLPGSAERIFRMTEKQLQHSIELENAEAAANRQLLDAEIAQASRAQWFTFVLVVIFLLLAAYALSRGQEIATIGAGLAALATIAYALRGKKTSSDNQSSADDGEPGRL